MVGVVGNWVLTIDWDCDGIFDGTVNIIFRANGTLITKGVDSHKGRWFQNAGLIVWTFEDSDKDVKHLVYTANLAGSSMTGVQGFIKPKGMKGCFSGQKVETLPKIAKSDAKAKSFDPLIGK